MPDYTTIIGLEVHVQLATQSKLFCRCSTQFGAEPNTQTCPVCIGLPGSLPVMNEEALNLALKTAVALNCTIPPLTKWDRKQYYYPDLPKGYQISQYDMPMSEHGYLEISDSKDRFLAKQVRILRAHLEEDAGKSVHDEVAGRADSVIDLNRTGTPLLEIVSEPDMRSGLEARAYLDELKLLLTYIGVSDCNMQEGSLRVDANVNLHIDKGGETIATPIVEIKNMNSFRAVERAIEYEAGRQYNVWQETGAKLGDFPKQTRGWDDAAGVTRGQRSKEESSDYRYFPDPDLVPVSFSDEQVAQAKSYVADKLPSKFRKKLSEEHKLSPYDTEVILATGISGIDYYFGASDNGEHPKQAANIISQHILSRMNQDPTLNFDNIPVPSGIISNTISMMESGLIPSARLPDVIDCLFEFPNLDVPSVVQRIGIEEVDDSELQSLCQSLLDANPRIVEDVKSGKQQAVGALIGQAKKQNPNADPSKVRQMCLELIAKM